jgi:hypothetical protein
MNPYLYISLFRRQRLNALTSAVAPMAGGNAISRLVIARVLADAGTFEGGEKCLAINLQILISMSFFEDASLVLIPSAQKTSKVYSVKPTDGTGDLTFTRSNDTASRVASNGLMRTCADEFGAAK